MMRAFNGKTAVVTGAASAIGLATARAFAAEGMASGELTTGFGG